MKPLYKGLLLAVVHLLIVSSLGAKLLYDRATRPHLWVRTVSFDPETPLRGRYASLRILVTAPPMTEKPLPSLNGPDKSPVIGQWLTWNNKRGHLAVRDGQLCLLEDAHGNVGYGYQQGQTGPEAVLAEPIAFYLPEHVADPTRPKPGRELWAEVTIPRKGPPRPIRLGFKENGQLTPLDLR